MARNIFLAVGGVFLGVGIFEIAAPHNVIAACVNGITGAIFLFLGLTQRKGS